MVDRALHDVAQAGDAALLRELLPHVTAEDIDAPDETGLTPLARATLAGHVDAVAVLLAGGADPDREYLYQDCALRDAPTPAIAKLLLDAGADLRNLPRETRRRILGLPDEPSIDLMTATALEFRRSWRRRFVTHNPESMDDPFWLAMIRSGVNAYLADKHFKQDEIGHPVWCADRFGQSLTFLPDGRIVQVAGEHEDYYDSDFCIYNDVFVHAPDGTVKIYGYPEDVFPPTDFHTATLVGETIWLIGSLGYKAPASDRTPVFALDTRSFHIERVDIDGESPGWLYRHRAVLGGQGAIRITDGKIVRARGERSHARNEHAFVLDVKRARWSKD
jgi:hypothetical protein